MRHIKVKTIHVDTETGVIEFFNKRGTVLCEWDIASLSTLWGSTAKCLIKKGFGDSKNSAEKEQASSPAGKPTEQSVSCDHENTRSGGLGKPDICNDCGQEL